MEENAQLWNLKNLESPPVIICESAAACRDVAVLLNVFKEAVDFFGDLTFFDFESALLSRCIYRMKMKFRSDKGLQVLLKLNRCLLQYLDMNFVSSVTHFYELLPRSRTLQVYMPSRNMLDFILVRLQGLTMLLNRIVETSQIAANLMAVKISYGHVWRVALIMFGVVSRISMIADKMMSFCFGFYSKILQFRKSLTITEPKWLPASYQFPDDLKTWLVQRHITEIEKHERGTLQSNKTPDTFQTVNVLNKFQRIEGNKFEDEKPKLPNFYSTLQSDDIGEVVPRPGNGDTCNLSEMSNSTVATTKLLLSNKRSSRKKKEGKGCKQQTKNVENMVVYDTPQNFKEIQTAKVESVIHCYSIDNSGIIKGRLSRKDKDSKISNFRVLQSVDNKVNKEQDVLPMNFENSFSCQSEMQLVERESLQEGDKVKKNKMHRQIKHKKMHDVNNVEQILQTINSVAKLQKFMKNQETCRDNQWACVSSTLDKLQWHMLDNEIKKYIKKEHKSVLNHAKGEKYLLKAKNMLKLSLS